MFHLKKNNETLKKILFLIVAVFFGFVTLPVLIGVYRHCWHATDAGLYAQALAKTSFLNPNPYISIRNQLILNDHFEPIWILLSPLTFLFKAHYLGVLYEFLFPVLSCLPIYALYKEGRIHFNKAILIFIFLLFNMGLIQAMFFPFHPATYSIFPLVLLCYSILKEKSKLIFGATLLLLLFREEYIFATAMLSLNYLILKKDKKKLGISLLLLSLIYGFIVFVLRKYLVPSTSSYGMILLKDFFNNPWFALKQYFEFTNLFLIIGLFLPPLVFFQKSSFLKKAPFILILIPLLAVRVISVKWGYHYGTAISIMCLFVFISFDKDKILSNKRIIIALALIAFFDFRLIGGSVKAYLFNKGSFSNYCTYDAERLSSIDKGINYLLKNRDGKALVFPNLTLALAERENIHMAGSWGPRDGIRTYNYLFLEKNGHGNPYPLTYEYYIKLRERALADPSTKVMIDDQHVFLAKGQFEEQF